MSFKYDQMITTKNSENIEYTIHSLNSVKFKINEEMLNYIIEEWNKENSVLFKGYNKLLEIFFSVIDPTDDGGQFQDRGSQYQTAIFYTNDHQQQQAKAYIEQMKNTIDNGSIKYL